MTGVSAAIQGPPFLSSVIFRQMREEHEKAAGIDARGASEMLDLSSPFDDDRYFFAARALFSIDAWFLPHWRGMVGATPLPGVPAGSYPKPRAPGRVFA